MPRDCSILREVNFGNQCLVDAGRTCKSSLCPYASAYFKYVDAERVYCEPPKPEAQKKRTFRFVISVREKVFHRDGYRCLRCKTTEDLSFDHVVPKSHGGPKSVKNGQTLCRKCNTEKGCKTIDYRNFSPKIN